jgi:transcription factor 1
VLTQSLCTISDLDPAIISPYDSHWYPRSRDSKFDGAGFRAKRPGHPMMACTLVPKPFNEIPIKGDKIDSWDFVLRNAFVLARSPIKKALGYDFPP